MGTLCRAPSATRTHTTQQNSSPHTFGQRTAARVTRQMGWFSSFSSSSSSRPTPQQTPPPPSSGGRSSANANDVASAPPWSSASAGGYPMPPPPSPSPQLHVSEEYGECAVCFDPLCTQQTAVFVGRSRRRRVCSHFFHLPCAMSIAEHNPTCPVCRAPFAAVLPVPSPRDDPAGWFAAVDVDGDGRWGGSRSRGRCTS